MTATHKILGITNDVDTCECCGKTGLKRTVIIGVLDRDGNVMGTVHYGSNCAAIALRFRRGADVEKLAIAAELAAQEAERNRIVIVNENPADVCWVVESVGSNGGSINRLCFAKGMRSAIYDWAEKAYPHKLINVRIAR